MKPDPKIIIAVSVFVVVILGFFLYVPSDFVGKAISVGGFNVGEAGASLGAGSSVASEEFVEIPVYANIDLSDKNAYVFAFTFTHSDLLSFSKFESDAETFSKPDGDGILVVGYHEQGLNQLSETGLIKLGNLKLKAGIAELETSVGIAFDQFYILDSSDNNLVESTVDGSFVVQVSPKHIDTDGDGVMDFDDACPTLSMGEGGYQGCPKEDIDGDGIGDDEDSCILKPGEASDNPKMHGCPPYEGTATVSLKEGESIDYQVCGWDFRLRMQGSELDDICNTFVLTPLGGHSSGHISEDQMKVFYDYISVKVKSLSTTNSGEKTCLYEATTSTNCEEICNGANEYITENLISFWPLENLEWDNNYGGEIVKDYHGDLVGKTKGATLTQNGKIDNAIQFTGKENYIDVDVVDNLAHIGLYVKMGGGHEQVILETGNDVQANLVLRYKEGKFLFGYGDELQEFEIDGFNLQEWNFIYVGLGGFRVMGQWHYGTSVENVEWGDKIRIGGPVVESDSPLISNDYLEGYVDEVVLFNPSSNIATLLCLADGKSLIAFPEICDNNIDDNQDGLIDCADPMCTDVTFKTKGYICHEGTTRETVCDDGSDNDNNGAADCADPVCVNDPACVIKETQCDDLSDNDGDGFIDCTDPDCQTPGIDQCQFGVGDSAKQCVENNGKFLHGGVLCCWSDKECDLGNKEQCIDYTCVQSKEAEWQCDDGLDNDGNGEADCVDLSCQNFIPVPGKPTNGNIGPEALSQGYFNVCDDWDFDGLVFKDDACPLLPGLIGNDGLPIGDGCPPGDADGDGVKDDVDQCPNSPKYTPIDEFGCILPDSDGDGVIDKFDKCSGTGNLIVDSKGCPADSDLDGVFEIFDKCPKSPKGAVVDEDGCSSVETPIKCADNDEDGFDICPIGFPDGDSNPTDCHDKNPGITICGNGYVCEESKCVSQLCGEDEVCQQSEYFIGESLEVNACGVDYEVKVTGVTDTCVLDVTYAGNTISPHVPVNKDVDIEKLQINVPKLSTGSCQIEIETLGCDDCVDDTILISEINKWLGNELSDAGLIKSINLWLTNEGTCPSE